MSEAKAEKPETKPDMKSSPETKAKPTTDLTPQIAARAYELYERQGHQDGQSAQNWDKAEQEIRAKPTTKAEAKPAAKAESEPETKAQPTADTNSKPAAKVEPTPAAKSSLNPNQDRAELAEAKASDQTGTEREASGRGVTAARQASP